MTAGLPHFVRVASRARPQPAGDEKFAAAVMQADPPQAATELFPDLDELEASLVMGR